MSKIIISYRRDDTEVIAGRICDKLIGRYGTESVFMDIDSIPFGVDFREYVRGVLEDADALVAIIGPKWLTITKNQNLRLHQPDDPVRIELEKAFELGIPVVPILVDGASMPEHDKLPESLKDLSFRNAAFIDAGRDFHQHMDRLIRSLDKILGHRSGPPTAGPATSKSGAASPGMIGEVAYRWRWVLILTVSFAALVAAGVWFALSSTPKHSTVEHPPVSSAPVSCDEERNLRSLATTIATLMVFQNVGTKTIRLYWLDHGGNRRLYATLERGQMVAQQTYVTHPWVITDMTDKCQAIYMPASTNLTIEIRI